MRTLKQFFCISSPNETDPYEFLQSYEIQTRKIAKIHSIKFGISNAKLTQFFISTEHEIYIKPKISNVIKLFKMRVIIYYMSSYFLVGCLSVYVHIQWNFY